MLSVYSLPDSILADLLARNAERLKRLNRKENLPLWYQELAEAIQQHGIPLSNSPSQLTFPA